MIDVWIPLYEQQDRTVGGRGQITILTEIRERYGIRGGDHVTVIDGNGNIIIDPNRCRQPAFTDYYYFAPTTQYDTDTLYSFEVEVKVTESPLTEDSAADSRQIRTISIADRIHNNVGFISDYRMTEVDHVIQTNLGAR